MREVRVTKVCGAAPQNLPFYTADRAMGRTWKPYTVEKILQTVFSEDYEKTIREYIKTTPEAISRAIRVEDAKGFALIEIGKLKTKTSWKQELSNTAIDFLIPTVIEAEVPAEKKKGSLFVVASQRRKYNVTFRMRYVLDLIKKQCSAPMLCPVQFFPEDEMTKGACADEYLLPIMGNKEYAEAARKMLELYYPEALKKPMAVDGHELARRMKIHVQEVWFEPGSDVYGRIFFKKSREHFDIGTGEIGYYEVPAMCILINRNLCKTPELVNSTIVHECCHVFLDMPFFKLQIMGGSPFTTYSSRMKKGINSDECGPEALMEKQAEKLPAYVLMEEEVTKKEIERLIAEYNGKRNPDVLRWVIKHLAATFKVSPSMAKYRLIELGYPEAEGVYNYFDGQRIPDHGCKGEWRRGITYTISRMDAAKLMLEDRRFSAAIRNGRYVYVEGHFCLDAEGYVIRDRNDIPRLSTYARWNIDECCISFSVRRAKSNVVYINGQAAKTGGQPSCRHEFNGEPGSKERIETNHQVGTDARLWMEIRRQGFETVREEVLYIMEKFGVTQEEISMRLGVSRPAFASWFSKGISLRHVVAICIALNVRADIGEDIVDLAGYSFMNNQEHALLLSFLFETESLTVPRANEIMLQHKMKPLTEGRSQDLAEAV